VSRQPAAACEGIIKKRVFFFVNKKEAKKTLLIWARAGEDARAPESKSFLLLFYKKEALTSSLQQYTNEVEHLL